MPAENPFPDRSRSCPADIVHKSEEVSARKMNVSIDNTQLSYVAEVETDGDESETESCDIAMSPPAQSAAWRRRKSSFYISDSPLSSSDDLTQSSSRSDSPDDAEANKLRLRVPKLAITRNASQFESHVLNYLLDSRRQSTIAVEHSDNIARLTAVFNKLKRLSECERTLEQIEALLNEDPEQVDDDEVLRLVVEKV